MSSKPASNAASGDAKKQRAPKKPAEGESAPAKKNSRKGDKKDAKAKGDAPAKKGDAPAKKGDAPAKKGDAPKKGEAKGDAAKKTDAPAKKDGKKGKRSEKDAKKRSSKGRKDNDQKSRPVNRGRASGVAVVKAVLSGDQVVLMGGANVAAGSMPPERTVTLSGITAPRIARRKDETDKPFAWQSREFVRQKCIGQTVSFAVNFTSESGREYGDIFVGPEKESLTQSVVRAGWATVNQRDGKVHPERQALLDLSVEAEQEGLGIWNKGNEPQVREIDWSPNAAKLFSEFKGKALHAVVDHVREGATLRCEIVGKDGSLKHKMVTVFLAGVQCPRVPPPMKFLEEQYQKKKSENPDSKAQAPQAQKLEPFALEARFFTEARLLHRDVNLYIHGVDKSDNIFATVLVPQGNISAKLLELGYGKLLNWTATMSPHSEVLKAAAEQAQIHRRRIAQNYTAPAHKNEHKDFQATVVRVTSGDSVTVNDGKNEIRVQLASIKAPKLAGPRSNKKDEDWAFEAREFLRSKLIGKKVKVVLDYVRPAFQDSRDKGDRQYVSIISGKSNISESLVVAGLAEVINHRMEDSRSAYYDLYIEAERKAQAAKVGMHGKPPVPRKIVDLTERAPRNKAAASAVAAAEETPAENAEEHDVKDKKDGKRKKNETPTIAAPISKIKQYLPFLQRDKEVKGVVEHVFSASKFKILVPKENCMLFFTLGLVRIPRSDDEKLAEFTKAATAFCQRELTQRDVKIQIDDVDLGDNFRGTLFCGSMNLALELVTRGWAQLFRSSAEKSKYKNELFMAEAKAKENKIGLWAHWVERVREEPKEVAVDSESMGFYKLAGSGRRVKISVMDVEDAVDFSARIGDADGPEIEAKMAEFNEKGGVIPDSEATAFDIAAAASSDDGEWFPTKGKLAACKFSGDEKFHRVRVEGRMNGLWLVYFVDYGNRDTVDIQSLCRLPKNLHSYAPRVKSCTLSGLKCPSTGSEYHELAREALIAYTEGKELEAVVDMFDNTRRLHMTLYDTEIEAKTAVAADVDPAAAAAAGAADADSKAEPKQPEMVGGLSINQILVREGFVKVQERPPKTLAKVVAAQKDDEDRARREHLRVWQYGNVSDDEDEDDDRRDGGRVPRK